MLSNVLTSADVGCCCVDDQPSRSTPEAEQPIFVYRLLRKKEVNKDLVHQEVWFELLSACQKHHIKVCQLRFWHRRSMCCGQTTESGTRQRLSRCFRLCSAATVLLSVALAWHQPQVCERPRFTRFFLQLHIKDMKAVLEYPKEEESEEVDLTDLMKDGHIALSKSMRVMKIFAHDLTGYKPVLLGRLQPQPHLMVPISMLSNSLPRVSPLTVPGYTSRLLSQLTVFAVQFGPLSFSNSNHGWSHEQMHIALTLS